MKVVSKSPLMELEDVRQVNREISIMRLLSSEQWFHKNIVQFREAYHSASHFFFRMDFAGPETLHRRLLQRSTRPLLAGAARSLMLQGASAIAHLHDGPHVCHLDIKPENFIVQEVDGESVLKLADFGTAMVVLPGELQRYSRGTLPFMAPEVVLSHEYDGFAADMWSVGVLALEFQCGIHVLERALELPKAGIETCHKTVQRIVAGLGSPEAVRALLCQHCLVELRDLLPTFECLTCNVLKEAVSERWSAVTVADYLLGSSLRNLRRRQQ